MRPRKPVACRITIGAPSPPQSRACKRTPLTFTKRLRGSVFFISKVLRVYTITTDSLIGFVLDRRRFPLGGFRFRRADIFERNRLEQIVTHSAHLRQHAVHARIAVGGSLIESYGFDCVREHDRRSLSRQEQALARGACARVGLDNKAAGLEAVENRLNRGLPNEEFAGEGP